MRDAGDSGEGFGLSDCGHRQEEVPGAFGHHGGPVHVDHQETHPAAFRESHLPLRGQNRPAVQVSTQNVIASHTNREESGCVHTADKSDSNQIPTPI